MSLGSVNIVFLGNFLYPEGMGAAKRVQHFINGVRADPNNLASVLLLRQGHAGRDDGRLAGVHEDVPYLTIGANLHADWRLPWNLFRYLVQGCRYLWRARRLGWRNIVFLYGEPNLENIVFVIFARMSGYRLIVDVVEDFYLLSDNASLASRLKAASARFTAKHMAWFADGLIAISTYLTEKFTRISDGSFPVRMIPVSVDISRVSASVAEFHRPVRILYAGSFGEKDGVEGLIAAFECCARKFPEIELIMVGKGMQERIEVVRSRISESPQAEHIRYLGFLADQEYFDLLGGCDIPCVVRVQSEFANRGFPFKLGEFLATGRPVIASRVGDIPSYLTDKHNAVLVEPGSVDSITVALEYLLGNQQEALSIGRAGRKVAEAQFDGHSNGRKLLDVIHELDPD